VDEIQLEPKGFSNIKDFAINERTKTLYVTNENDDTISIIDTEVNEVIDTVLVGDIPRSITVNEETNKVYVASIGDNTVTVLQGIE
jgi:YVTN family beta-propeller protein